MAEIDDEKKWRVTRSVNKLPMDAVGNDLSFRNHVAQDRILMGGADASVAEPAEYQCRHFYTRTVPDNTNYPDSVAPIGSCATRLIITAGAVTGSEMYLKVSAGTWEQFTTS